MNQEFDSHPTNSGITNPKPNSERIQPSGQYTPMLVCFSGPHRGISFPIVGLETTLGRGSAATIYVSDEMSSRLHARILYKNWQKQSESPQCYIEDSNSRNGTQVNGSLVTGLTPLHERDRIQIGATIYCFSIRDEDEMAYELSLVNRATKDALTGLANRRHFDMQLLHFVQRFSTDQIPFALLIVDADHFKNVNDMYGHDVGDKVLAHVAGIIKSTSRAREVCGRWGGEEFVVLLPNTDAEGALVAAERLRQAVESNPVHSALQTIPITVSIGGAIAHQGDTVDTMFRRADQQLYRAKQGGRNRACVEENIRP